MRRGSEMDSEFSAAAATKSVANDWVKAARAGDNHAFSRLVESHYSMVYGVVLSVVKDFAVSEDIAQEVFLAAWNHMGTLRQGGAFPMWLRKIARNLALNWIKSASYRRALAERRTANESLEDPTQMDPELHLARVERRTLVRAGLDALKPKFREALVSFYLDEQSIAEAAQSLGISTSAMKVRLRKGRKMLRAHFESEWEDDLKEELLDLSPALAHRRIATYMAVGPVMPLPAHLAPGSGLGLWLHELQHGGSSGFLNVLFKGGLVAMSAKKLGVVTAILLLALVGTLGGWNLLGHRGDVNETLSTESSDVDFDVVAEDDPIADGGAAADSVSQDSTSNILLATDEALIQENAAGSAEDSGAIPAEGQKDHGKIDDSALYVSISGVVIDEKGNGVAEANVMAIASGYTADGVDSLFGDWELFRDPDHQFVTVTEVSGAYTISGIQYEGTLRLKAAAPGYSQERGSQLEISVQPGDSLEEVNIFLSPGVTGFGKVLSATEEPVGDAVVTMTGYDLESNHGFIGLDVSQTAYSDADGRFYFSLEERGTVTVFVESPRFGTAAFSEFPVFGDGEEVVLHMPEPATFTGTLRWADRSPAEGVQAQLTSWFHFADSSRLEPAGKGFGATSDGEGGFVLAELDTEMFYRIQLFGENQQTLSPRIDLGILKSGETRRWEYVIESLIIVRGLVLGAVTGQPLRDVKVDLLRKDESLSFPGRRERSATEVAVDADGAYELHIPSGPGIYHIYARHQFLNLFAEGYDIGETVSLAAGEVRDLDLTLPDTFTMSIRLVDFAGKPIPNFQTAENHGKDWYSQGDWRTDANGQWSWSGFRAGVETNIVVVDADFRTVASSTAVIGEPGEIVPEQELVLQEYGGIQGIAVDADGNPFPNVEIDMGISYGLNQSRSFHLQTDEFGEFVTLNEIPATDVSIEMVLLNSAIDELLVWQSEVFNVPPNHVAMLGAVRFVSDKELE